MAEQSTMLKPREVAKQLYMKPATVIRLIKRGELPAVDVSLNPGSGKPRFLIDSRDLSRFLESRKVRLAPLPANSRKRQQRPAGWVEFF